VTSAHTRKATVEHLLLPNRYVPEAKSCCSEQTMLAGSGKTGEPKVHFLVRSPSLCSGHTDGPEVCKRKQLGPGSLKPHRMAAPETGVRVEELTSGLGRVSPLGSCKGGSDRAANRRGGLVTLHANRGMGQTLPGAPAFPTVPLNLDG
jgi:hypothetical protein